MPHPPRTRLGTPHQSQTCRCQALSWPPRSQLPRAPFPSTINGAAGAPWRPMPCPLAGRFLGGIPPLTSRFRLFAGVRASDEQTNRIQQHLRSYWLPIVMRLGGADRLAHPRRLRRALLPLYRLPCTSHCFLGLRGPDAAQYPHCIITLRIGKHWPRLRGNGSPFTPPFVIEELLLGCCHHRRLEHSQLGPSPTQQPHVAVDRGTPLPRVHGTSEKGAVDVSCRAGRAATRSTLADPHAHEDIPMVAVTAPAGIPRIPCPHNARLFHEEVAELEGCPCLKVVPSTVRACVPASRCLVKERYGRTEPVCPTKGAMAFASYIQRPR